MTRLLIYRFIWGVWALLSGIKSIISREIWKREMWYFRIILLREGVIYLISLVGQHKDSLVLKLKLLIRLLFTFSIWRYYTGVSGWKTSLLYCFERSVVMRSIVIDSSYLFLRLYSRSPRRRRRYPPRLHASNFQNSLRRRSPNQILQSRQPRDLSTWRTRQMSCWGSGNVRGMFGDEMFGGCRVRSESADCCE